MKKTRLTAEQDGQLREALRSAYNLPESDRQRLLAMTLSYAYDEELPIAKPLEAIARFVRAGNRPEDNRVHYIKPFGIDKQVWILDSNCTITEKKVTPGVREELPLVEVTSPDFYICLKDFLAGDYDGLAAYTDEANEMLDRHEIKFVMDLLDAAATGAGNTVTLDSNQTAIDFPKMVEMFRKVAKYGRNVKFICGSNVYTDTLLMDYVADTNRKYGAENLNIEVIPVEDHTVEVDGSGQVAVLDADTAFLVAVSDRAQNKPVLVARRKLEIITDKADTTGASQDRVVIESGNRRHVGSSATLTRGQVLYEQFGAVVIQPKNVVKFTRS